MMAVSKKNISVWEQDPGSGSQPDGGILLQVPAPDISSTTLPIVIQNPSKQPVPDIYDKATPEFRYWTAAEALHRGSSFWSKQLPNVSWQVGKILPVDLDMGEDFNAYYDRVGLRFFHGVAAGRTIYSGESPEVVCHEQGHAILDSIKPELWDAASIEIASFHESFGDMSAMLCSLQLESMRQGVLDETKGQLYHSSRLSRLAEQLGWAIRQTSPADTEPDCLRNAVNSFFYQDPNKLPPRGSASTLSSEPHSFSRVFTGAFLEGLANMFLSRKKQDQLNLLQASEDLSQLLLSAIKATPVVPSFYSQVAAHMISLAGENFPANGYVAALKSAFMKHGIIATDASIPTGSAGIQNGKTMDISTPDKFCELQKLHLSVGQYGLGISNILVHVASETKRFDVSGAALNFGPVTPTTHDEAAKSFVEDLIRRGKLKVPDVKGKTLSASSKPANKRDRNFHFSHELKMVNKAWELKRIRIDCGIHF